MRFLKCLEAGLFISLLGFGAATQAGPIDLHDFVADPSVTIAVDGDSAIMREDSDPGVGTVVLVNDPGLGDPEVIVPGLSRVLSFDYDFAEGLGEDDEFGVFVIDASTGAGVGASWVFFTSATSSGTISFDLSALIGVTLGLQFQLERLPGDMSSDSAVTVSNVALGQAPAPAPLMLMVIGLLGLGTVGFRRSRF